jgi:pseudouridine synthase
VSLSRALSKLGIASRTEAEAMIQAGRVRVGDHVVRDPAWRVDLEIDPIRIDDAPQERAEPQYWLLHKPVGYVTTRRDPQGRPTVYDLLPRDLPFVAPVGRLDLMSSGLLLLSNDTQLGARLTNPHSHVPKVYEARLDAPIGAVEARKLARGIEIQGRMTRPATVELRGGKPSRDVSVTLVEGRNRQVRRMFLSIGRKVASLRRVAIGPLRLDGLAEGKARVLRTSEVRALKAIATPPAG